MALLSIATVPAAVPVVAKVVLETDVLGCTDLTSTTAGLGKSKKVTSAGEALEAAVLGPLPTASAAPVHDPTTPAALPLPAPAVPAPAAVSDPASAAYGPGGAMSTPARKRRKEARKRKKKERGATAAPASIE